MKRWLSHTVAKHQFLLWKISSVSVQWDRFEENRKFWTQCGASIVFIYSRKSIGWGFNIIEMMQYIYSSANPTTEVVKTVSWNEVCGPLCNYIHGRVGDHQYICPSLFNTGYNSVPRRSRLLKACCNLVWQPVSKCSPTTLSREEDCSKRAAILSGNQSANVHLTEDCLMDRQLKVCHVIFYEPFVVIICYRSAKDTVIKEHLVKKTVRIYHACVHENDVVIICYCKGHCVCGQPRKKAL